MSNEHRTQESQTAQSIRGAHANRPHGQLTGMQKVIRYSIIVVLAFALIVVTGWLLQVRSEAQAERQASTTIISTYIPSNSAGQKEQTTTGIAIAPAAPVVKPARVEPAAEVAAPSLVPTPTSTPVAATADKPRAQKELSTIVRGQGAALYAAPGGQVLESLPSGDGLLASGRSADGMWLYVHTTSGAMGWVAESEVLLFNVDQLAVVSEEMPVAPEAQIVTGADSSNSAAVLESAAPVPVASDSAERPQLALRDGQVAATVSLTGSRLNVRSGPGTNYPIVAKAYPAEAFFALGRDSAGAWIEIRLPEALDQVAWVAAEYVTLNAPIQELSVSDRTGGPPVASVASAVNVSINTPGSGVEASALSGHLAIQSSGLIYIHTFATGRAQPLTAGFDPAISPDGRTVAFVRDGGQNGIYLIGIDGGNERRIFNGGELLRSPAWSLDGQWIAFSHKIGSVDCRELGLGICYPDNGPFLDSFPKGSQPLYGIGRIDRDGNNFRDLATLESAQAPDWGSGGIAYSATRSIEITQDEPGNGGTRMVVSKPFYQDPAWRPDGGRIALQSREGTHWEIFIVNPDGSGLVPLTRPATALVDELPHNVAPAWSPDGNHIVFLSSRDSNNDHGPWRLWVMNGDGSDQRPLAIDLPLQYAYANEQIVSWGP